jgi:hypothetical protein
MLDGVNIGAILNEEGNIVQAVLLKCGGGPSGSSTSSNSTTSTINDNDNNENIIEQICVDTCPQRRMVEQILGGNGITFVGQYEDEGIVVVASKQQQQQENNDHTRNPHRLQPPLHNLTICGDILLLKVRQEEEEDIDPTKPFFQDYTKEDYAAFASKTIEETAKEEEPQQQQQEELSCSSTSTEDCSSSYSSSSIEEEEKEEDEEEQSEDGEEKDSSEATEEEHEEDDDDDDDYYEDVSELGMFNLVMGSFLRQYQENNGRGPSTEELLVMRQTLAEKMGIVLDSITINTTTTAPTTNSNIIQKTKQSSSNALSNNHNGLSPPKKRVKFTIQE